MAEQNPQPQSNPANTPPRDQWPNPVPYTEWTPDEYLEALEENQDDRRRNDR